MTNFDSDEKSATPGKTAEERPRNGWQFGRRGPRHDQLDWLNWARTPGFNPMKAVAVIAGFAIFPPLGVAALVYFVWNSRRHGMWSHSHAMAGGPGFDGRQHGYRCGRHRGFTGNRAFDEYQEAVMQDLAAEREAFSTYREEQRRKRDAQTFADFRSSRPASAPVKTGV